MARQRQREEPVEELPAQDSFLDLIANIVGIMILLVVIVGIRAATSDFSTSTSDSPKPSRLTGEQVKNALHELRSVTSDVADLKLKTDRLDQRADELDYHRLGLVAYVDEVERELAARRANLDDPQREEYDLRVAISQAESELDSLMRERIALESGLSNTKTLHNVETPIIRKVGKVEVTLWVDQGRVAIVPLEEMVKKCVAELNGRAGFHLPKGISELRDGGFVIRYAIMSRELTTRTGATMEQMVPVFQIRPVKNNPGELITDALQQGSRLDAHLNSLDADETTVTMWVPSSGFADVGPIRTMVAKRGFSTAIWARPEGRFIEISPLGSESKAQ